MGEKTILKETGQNDCTQVFPLRNNAHALERKYIIQFSNY